MLAILNRLRVYFDWLWEGKRPLPRQVEPAIVEIKGEEEFREHNA
jgi:hypothetical protein